MLWARHDSLTWVNAGPTTTLDLHSRRRTKRKSSSTSLSRWTYDITSESDRRESIYTESRVADGEFRLLQIEPAKNIATPISARIFTATLNDPPTYEAVSYRWECTRDAPCIMVNGVEFPVMENVVSLLSEFRRQAFPASPTLWIDSVCINQSCTEDRNTQVQLMGKIYSKASVVRMWLGTESDHADEAFELIRRCGPMNSISQDVLAQSVINDEAGAKALTRLLRRDYWNRMWVFQEIVLANKAVVHCGKLRAPWSNFRWLDLVSSNHKLWLPAQVERPWLFELRRALFTIAHFCVSSAEACHVNNVLHSTRHLLCQDPRDKLFALRGVCEALVGMVKVDYSVPVRDVFTAFAMNQILADGNLSALLTAGLWNPVNGDDINLPSWVPDLRGMCGVDIRYLAANFMNSFDADGSLSSTNYTFSVKRNDFFRNDGVSTLNVQAILVGFVYRHRSLNGIAHSKTGRKRLIKALCSSPGDRKLSAGRLHQLFEGLIFGDKTTLMKHTSSERHIQERARRLVLGFYEDLCRLFHHEPAFIDFLRSFDEGAPGSQGSESLLEEAQLSEPDQLHLFRMEYLGRAAETTDRQATALFLTVDGRLGIGPRSVQNDDMIVIVRGCRVPLALRRNASDCKLVGPVYVSGIMQGEVVRSHEGVFPGFEPIRLL